MPFILMVGLVMVQAAKDYIFPYIKLDFRPIKVILQYNHSFLHTKVSCDLTVVHLPNQLGTLALRNTKVAQVAKYCFLEVEIRNFFTIYQHLVCEGEIWIIFVQLRPSKGLMATRVENNSQCCNWGLTKAVCNMIGAALFVFNFQVELLQICRPLLMVIILQLPLCLYKLNRQVIYVHNHIHQGKFEV